MVAPTYPGIYLEEISSGVRTIVGVATSIAAFVGQAARGRTDEPVIVTSFADYERQFGGLDVNSPMSFAVRDFFLNGGSQGVVVRLFGGDQGAATAVVELSTTISLKAKTPGSWGKNLRAMIDFTVTDEAIQKASALDQPWVVFNLTVWEDTPGGSLETHRNLTLTDTPRRIDRVLKADSLLVEWNGDPLPAPIKVDVFGPPSPALAAAIKELVDATTEAGKEAARLKIRAELKNLLVKDPVSRKEDALADAKAKVQELRLDPTLAAAIIATAGVVPGPLGALAAALGILQIAVNTAQDEVDAAKKAIATGATDGKSLVFKDYFPDGGQDKKTGLFALEKTDLFNLLCLPTTKENEAVYLTLLSPATAYCEKRRAMLLVDSPAAWQTDNGRISDSLRNSPAATLTKDLGISGTVARNAALFFPRIKYANPLHNGQVEEFPPCGVVAGVFAKTDATRGVWKAPAGLDAGLVGVSSLAVNVTDAENGLLNPVGINCLRSFPAAGRVIWGARTLRGNDQLGDEYKYIPIRRLALYIEESLYRGTQWAVFEPNDEPLWAQLRLNIGSFMHDLFRQGAFQGRTPKDSYLVKCDKETTTQSDINRGVVNVLIGFAPLKPAEFVIIKLQQIAGQLEQ